MTAQLSVDKLAVTFRAAGPLVHLIRPGAVTRLTVLEDISFDLAHSQIMGIVGESGSGKTTLARAIAGLVPTASGSIMFDGRTLASARDFRAIRPKLAMMFQDPVASLSPRLRIGSL